MPTLSRKIFFSSLFLSSLLLPRRCCARSNARPRRPRPPKYPALPERDPGELHADVRRLRLRAARGDDPDARRREAAHGDPGAEGRGKGAPILLTRTPYDADTAHDAHATAPHLGLGARRLRQRRRDDRRGRLHPRRAGRARQVRLRGRLRDEPPARRPAEPDARRPRDGHLGHDRLAREERARDERQGRHPRHLVRRLPAADGAREPAPGAQGLGADEPDGGRLDGRRLVPQRRLPPAGHAATSTSRRRRAKNDDEVVVEPLRRLRRCSSRRGSAGELGAPPRARAARLLEASSSSTRATTPSGATRPSTRCSRRSRSRCP